MISVTLPLRLVSEANARGHWAKGARRAKQQRGVVRLAVRAQWRRLPAGALTALVVTLTRIAPRQLDGDNLQRALKAVRDGAADALGVDDGDPRIAWRYAQERPPIPRSYAVRIEVGTREDTEEALPW